MDVPGDKPETFSISKNKKQYTNKNPIAIWPTRTTPRIIVQSGCFTVHGTGKAPIEDLFAKARGPHARKLMRINILEPESVEQERSDMSLGRPRLFPELHSFASRLRRLYPSA